MKIIKTAYHFLGSLTFAIILIISAALFVIAGTFIESATESHLQAARYTYSSPLFFLLLAGFFINILFSATRRWPFKVKHIPFLITHLGLLMIIGGTVIKNLYGVQGNMVLMEGTSSSSIFVPNSYAIQISNNSFQTNLLFDNERKTLTSSPFEQLSVELIGYTPNVSERYYEQSDEEIFSKTLKELSTPPIDFFRNVSEDDVALGQFFHEWEQTHCWLYPVSKPLSDSLASIFNQLDIETLPEKEKLSCKLTSLLMEHIEPKLWQGISLYNALEELHWPLVAEFKGNESLPLLQAQLRSISEQMPHLSIDQKSETPEEKAHLLSAYFRNWNIHPEEILEAAPESPLTVVHEPIPSLIKLEDNIPAVQLHFKDNDISESVTLAYNRYGNGLKWPVANRYFVRFQPLFLQIPFTVRLRDARQVNIPGTRQPYSFECDIQITDRKSKEALEKTISMNNVHETWNGYRFYLANISPSDESAPKHVQIIVNHDPARYTMTYPGALLVFIGVILLFWKKFRSLT